MLTLTERVTREDMKCKECCGVGGFHDAGEGIGYECESCHGTGKRRVVYEVVAEVEVSGSVYAPQRYSFYPAFTNYPNYGVARRTKEWSGIWTTEHLAEALDGGFCGIVGTGENNE